MKTWFGNFWKSFAFALAIAIGLILVVILLPKWLFCLAIGLLFIGATIYKINKNQPF